VCSFPRAAHQMVSEPAADLEALGFMADIRYRFFIGEKVSQHRWVVSPAILQQAVRRGSTVPYCDEDIIEVIITQQQIAARIAELAQQITADYRDKQLVLIGVLTGSFVFLSDLMRQLDRPCEVDFLDASSYGDSTVSRGQVSITKGLNLSLTGKDVLVVEDIVDSGYTISELVRLLEAHQPASVKVCTLLDKPARREIPVELDYIGFVIPDQFVVGYGLDYAQCFRNLPFVAVLDEDSIPVTDQ